MSVATAAVAEEAPKQLTLREAMEHNQFSCNYKIGRCPSLTASGSPSEFLRLPSCLKINMCDSSDSEDSMSSLHSRSTFNDMEYDTFSSLHDPELSLSTSQSHMASNSQANCTPSSSRRLVGAGFLSVNGLNCTLRAANKLRHGPFVHNSGGGSRTPSLHSSPNVSRTTSLHASTVSSRATSTRSSLSGTSGRSSKDSLDGLNIHLIQSLIREMSILEKAQQVELPEDAPIYHIQAPDNVVLPSGSGENIHSSSTYQRTSQYERRAPAGQRASPTQAILRAGCSIAQAGSFSPVGSNASVSKIGGSNVLVAHQMRQNAYSLRPINRQAQRLEAVGVGADTVDSVQLMIDMQCMRKGPHHTKQTTASMLGTVQKQLPQGKRG